MPTTSSPRPFTPYQWCCYHGAQPGDRVLMDEPSGRAAFVIESIDDVAKKVFFSLIGVWANREWIAMEPRAEYILEKKGE